MSDVTRAQVLIVDDEVRFAEALAKELRHFGHTCAVCHDGSTAMTMFDDGDYDVVLLDLRLPPTDGIRVLEQIQSRKSVAEVIMLTGHGSMDSAIEAMKKGAYDYLTKPCELEELNVLIGKAADRGRVERENHSLRRILSRGSSTAELITQSAEMRRVVDEARKVAVATDVPVLITGESGTGKELIAREVHQHSPLGEHPFIAINCAALQSSLLESEIFGHEKGAFTGASQRKEGIVEVIHGGTLFLDEIAEVDESIQAKLLRFIQFGEFRRVGSTETRRVDIRIVAATNRALSSEIEQGRFREDLYYRLNVAQIRIPPLRDRPDDIPPLAERFLDKYSAKRPAPTLDAEAMQRLTAHSWPGNVRELENLVRRLLIFAESNPISDRDVVDALRGSGLVPEESPSSLTLEAVTQAHIRRVLSMCDGNKTLAAKRLGIAVKTLYNRLAED